MQLHSTKSLVVSRSCCTGLCLLLLSLSGCVEQSIVFKVLKDGTALIHVRSYVMPAPFSSANADPEVDKPKGVSQKHINALLERLGPGVSVKSNDNSQNSRGWPGTDLVLECKSVNELKITREDIGMLMSTDRNEGQDVKGNEESRLSGGPGLGLSFSLKENELNIHVDADFDKSEPASNDRAQDPFDDRPAPTNPIELALVTTVMRELRLGIFVETEREIAKTDASYPVRKNTLITLFKFDGSKADINKMYEIAGKKPSSREEIRASIEGVEGFEMETNENVIVEFK